MNTYENLKTLKMIKERLKTPKEAYIDGKTVMKKLNLSLKSKETICTKKN